jgi:hypothetical protein
MYMIFLKIITIRLDHVTEDYGLLDDAQEGFRHCRGTKRQLTKLRCLLADQRRRKKCISVLLYMDIINAFNSPNHCAIFFIMAANGFPEADVALFQRMYTDSFLVMSNLFGITAACFLARGTPQGAPPSPTVYCLIYDPILKMIRTCHRGCSMQEGSTPSGASCLADDLLLHVLMQFPQ